jgi:hypothetical protein
MSIMNGGVRGTTFALSHTHRARVLRVAVRTRPSVSYAPQRRWRADS